MSTIENEDAAFMEAFETIAKRAHQINVDNGWWYDANPNKAEKIALMHEELSEALTGLRHGDPPSDHIPNFTASEEELADAIVRIMDFAQKFNLRVASALLAKLSYNAGRGHKHGGKLF